MSPLRYGKSKSVLSQLVFPLALLLPNLVFGGEKPVLDSVVGDRKYGIVGRLVLSQHDAEKINKPSKLVLSTYFNAPISNVDWPAVIDKKGNIVPRVHSDDRAIFEYKYGRYPRSLFVPDGNSLPKVYVKKYKLYLNGKKYSESIFNMTIKNIVEVFPYKAEELTAQIYLSTSAIQTSTSKLVWSKENSNMDVDLTKRPLINKPGGWYGATQEDSVRPRIGATLAVADGFMKFAYQCFSSEENGPIKKAILVMKKNTEFSPKRDTVISEVKYYQYPYSVQIQTEFSFNYTRARDNIVDYSLECETTKGIMLKAVKQAKYSAVAEK